MILKGDRIERFVAAPDPAIRVLLLYGPDGGLVRERALKAVAAVAGGTDDPFRVAELTPADLKDDAARLADEAAALSFTGGRRAIRLRQAGNGQTDALRDVLEAPGALDSLVVVEAGELAPRDALRKLCEGHDLAAAAPCYADDERALDTVVRDSLAAHGLTVEPAALALLVASLGADRGVSRQELEKLVLYKADEGGEVSVADVEACIGDGAPLARDDVALAALSGDQAALDRALERCREAGDNPVSILRTVARHLQRLHLLALRRAAGGNLEAEIKRLRPPVFWKHQPILRGQLQLWSPQRLGQAMTIVAEAEMDCKTTGYPAEAACGRALE